MIEKFVDSKLSIFIALLTTCYIAYYLLLTDNSLHSSIASIIDYAHHLSIKEHLIILGLLPIYIAVMIFGSATVGLYLGATVQSLLSRTVERYR